mmetsp:Transcript_10801/g.35982  ORF Transcript_10801/g.35982 Transcript_10801/m.35982 type:complete len:275 (+) Transcript_10801:763-1587(+)
MSAIKAVTTPIIPKAQPKQSQPPHRSSGGTIAKRSFHGTVTQCKASCTTPASSSSSASITKASVNCRDQGLAVPYCCNAAAESCCAFFRILAVDSSATMRTPHSARPCAIPARETGPTAPKSSKRNWRPASPVVSRSVIRTTFSKTFGPKCSSPPHPTKSTPDLASPSTVRYFTVMVPDAPLCLSTFTATSAAEPGANTSPWKYSPTSPGSSSSMMVTVAWPAAAKSMAGSEDSNMRTRKVSSSSTCSSSKMLITMSLVHSPSRNSTTPQSTPS